MPIPVDIHLSHDANRRLLILISDAPLDAHHVEEELSTYGSTVKCQVTEDGKAAFVDFACDHGPLLSAYCFQLQKRKPYVPFPRGITHVLPGCSYSNFIFVQHVPRSLGNWPLWRHFNRDGNKVVEIYRPGPADALSSRALLQMEKEVPRLQPTKLYNESVWVSPNRVLQFYVIPQLSQLTNDREVMYGWGCTECNVQGIRENERLDEANKRAARAAEAAEAAAATAEAVAAARAAAERPRLRPPRGESFPDTFVRPAPGALAALSSVPRVSPGAPLPAFGDTAAARPSRSNVDVDTVRRHLDMMNARLGSPSSSPSVSLVEVKRAPPAPHPPSEPVTCAPAAAPSMPAASLAAAAAAAAVRPRPFAPVRSEFDDRWELSETPQPPPDPRTTRVAVVPPRIAAPPPPVPIQKPAPKTPFLWPAPAQNRTLINAAAAEAASSSGAAAFSGSSDSTTLPIAASVVRQDGCSSSNERHRLIDSALPAPIAAPPTVAPPRFPVAASFLTPTATRTQSPTFGGTAHHSAAPTFNRAPPTFGREHIRKEAVSNEKNAGSTFTSRTSEKKSEEQRGFSGRCLGAGFGAFAVPTFAKVQQPRGEQQVEKEEKATEQNEEHQEDVRTTVAASSEKADQRDEETAAASGPIEPRPAMQQQPEGEEEAEENAAAAEAPPAKQDGGVRAAVDREEEQAGSVQKEEEPGDELSMLSLAATELSERAPSAEEEYAAALEIMQQEEEAAAAAAAADAANAVADEAPIERDSQSPSAHPGGALDDESTRVEEEAEGEGEAGGEEEAASGEGLDLAVFVEPANSVSARSDGTVYFSADEKEEEEEDTEMDLPAHEEEESRLDMSWELPPMEDADIGAANAAPAAAPTLSWIQVAVNGYSSESERELDSDDLLSGEEDPYMPVAASRRRWPLSRVPTHASLNDLSENEEEEEETEAYGSVSALVRSMNAEEDRREREEQIEAEGAEPEAAIDNREEEEEAAEERDDAVLALIGRMVDTVVNDAPPPPTVPPPRPVHLRPSAAATVRRRPRVPVEELDSDDTLEEDYSDSDESEESDGSVIILEEREQQSQPQQLLDSDDELPPADSDDDEHEYYQEEYTGGQFSGLEEYRTDRLSTIDEETEEDEEPYHGAVIDSDDEVFDVICRPETGGAIEPSFPVAAGAAPAAAGDGLQTQETAHQEDNAFDARKRQNGEDVAAEHAAAGDVLLLHQIREANKEVFEEDETENGGEADDGSQSQLIQQPEDCEDGGLDDWFLEVPKEQDGEAAVAAGDGVQLPQEALRMIYDLPTVAEMSDYYEWLTRDDKSEEDAEEEDDWRAGLSASDTSVGSSEEPQVVPLPSSLPVSSWGPGAASPPARSSPTHDEKTTVVEKVELECTPCAGREFSQITVLEEAAATQPPPPPALYPPGTVVADRPPYPRASFAPFGGKVPTFTGRPAQ